MWDISNRSEEEGAGSAQPPRCLPQEAGSVEGADDGPGV
jgi:hypothetical protein